MQPSCDVIIPVGRLDRFLTKSINSAHESVGVNTRIILVNNSNEDQKQFIKLLRNKDIYLEQNLRGYARALNTPLEEQLDFNEYVTVLNSDDVVNTAKFIKQIDSIRKYGLDVSITKLRKFSGIFRIPKRFGDYDYNHWHKIGLLLGAYGADATQLFTRDYFLKCGNRDQSIHPDLVDLEYAYRNFGLANIKALPEELYQYRQHLRQMSKDRATQSDFMKITKSVQEFLDNIGLSNTDPSAVYFLQTFMKKKERKQINWLETTKHLEQELNSLNIQSKAEFEFFRILSIRS
jgi:glycosyltransferase involved in cell wall biosynthesis